MFSAILSILDIYNFTYIYTYAFIAIGADWLD